MIIEKRTVIKALREEPLESGSFFDKNNVKNCKVCAVGAVVRKSLKGKINGLTRNTLVSYCETITNEEYINEDVEYLLAKRNYLGALSTFFEWEAGSDDDSDCSGPNITPELRETLVEFVRKNFPTRFKVIDVDKFVKDTL